MSGAMQVEWPELDISLVIIFANLLNLVTLDVAAGERPTLSHQRSARGPPVQGVQPHLYRSFNRVRAGDEAKHVPRHTSGT